MVYTIVKSYIEGTKSIIVIPATFTNLEAARDYLKNTCKTIDGNHGEIFDISFDIEENLLYENADQVPREDVLDRDLEDVTFEEALDTENILGEEETF